MPVYDEDYYRDLAVNINMVGANERTIVFTHAEVKMDVGGDTKADFVTATVFVRQKRDKFVGVWFGIELEETYKQAWERVENPPTLNIIISPKPRPTKPTLINKDPMLAVLPGAELAPKNGELVLLKFYSDEKLDYDAKENSDKKSYTITSEKYKGKVKSFESAYNVGYRYAGIEGKTKLYKRELINISVMKDGKEVLITDGYIDTTMFRLNKISMYPDKLLKALGFKGQTSGPQTLEQQKLSSSKGAGYNLTLVKDGEKEGFVKRIVFEGYVLDNITLYDVEIEVSKQIDVKTSWDEGSRTVIFEIYSKGELKIPTPLSTWLANIEKPYKDSDYILDENGKRIAIKPHDSNDGYVTIGYGHALQTNDDASKYGFMTGSKQSIDKVKSSISIQLSNYNDYNENPAILTFQQAETLLLDDLVDYQTSALKFANETGKTFSQNEIDAITSLVYNGNKAYDPDSLLYYFLRKDKKGAINALHKAVNNGWYGDNEGLFRRRLMEVNIFFNSDYTFYDINELEKLKTVVGY